MSFPFASLTVLVAPHTSARLFCPPVRRPFAPFSHPPFAFRPSSPKSLLPAPTVSATLFRPPVKPPLYCSPSFRLREARHEVEPERRFSARWWPVELLFQGSKKVRGAGAAGATEEGLVARVEDEVISDEEGASDRLPAWCVSQGRCSILSVIESGAVPDALSCVALLLA